MQKNSNGLEIIKSAESAVRGCKVILTRKTTKSGNIRHGVVMEKHGRHTLVGSFAGLAPAFKVYKALAKA